MHQLKPEIVPSSAQAARDDAWGLGFLFGVVVGALLAVGPALAVAWFA